MKKLFALSVINILILISLTGCNKDENILGSNYNQTQFSIQGSWHVDQIQMLQAPTTGTVSALMKAALVPFGLMSASNVGWADVSFGARKWTQIQTGTYDSFNKIIFVNSETGWIISSYGYGQYNDIFKTTDGGSTWNIINSQHPFIFSVSFLDALIGWAAGQENYNSNGIYKSTDGGSNWILKYDAASGSVTSICFANEQTGFAVGSKNTQAVVYKTTDFGNSWNLKYISGATTLTYIKFLNSGFGYSYGYKNNGQSEIIKTVDGGNNWTEINIPGVYAFRSVCFVNENTGFAIGHDGNYNVLFYKTNNGGGSWANVNFGFNANSIYFTDNQNGYAVGQDGLILKTTDSGANWVLQPGGNGKYLNCVYILNSQTGFAIGDYGTILRQQSTTDTTVWTLQGKITNTIIKSITKANDDIYSAYGSYFTNDTNIIFSISDYSGGMGNTNAGGGTYSLTSSLNIKLNLANNEKWLITLKR